MIKTKMIEMIKMTEMIQIVNMIIKDDREEDDGDGDGDDVVVDDGNKDFVCGS